MMPPALAQRDAGDSKLYNESTLARRAEAARDPAEALARYLRVLAQNPTDIEALKGAGRAALDIGDPNAAINFLARAEQLAPNDGQVKAGLGSAMVQLIQPKSALKLFEEAIDRGVPLADIAADRGLAYDLRGDSKRARADYDIAIKSQPNSEITRRLALSMAMGRDTVSALATLDPLLRKQDKAAWRDRAFVLAISGDVKGAQDTANAVLPRSQAQALSPFLTRLPKLRASQQAAAVHFGQFPYDGQQYTEAQLFAAAGGYVAPVRPVQPTTVPTRGSQPDEEGDGIDLDTPSKLASRSSTQQKDSSRTNAPLVTGKRNATSSDAPLKAEKPRLQIASAALDTSHEMSTRDAPTKSLPDTSTSDKTKLSKPGPSDPVSARDRKKTATGAKGDAEKPANASRKDTSETSAKASAAKAKAAKDAAAKEKAEKAKAASAKKEPERHWVQVATGAYKPDLGKEWGKLKTRFPAILGRQTPWTVPLNRTNRLLIGPFKTPAEAQTFVNKAAGAGVSASRFSSSAGQAVERVSN